MNKSIKKFGRIAVSFVLAGAFILQASAANFTVSPSSGTYSSNFTVGVYVKSPSETVNAYSGSMTFAKDKIKVISISKVGSIVNYWASEPAFSNVNGTITFEGGTYNPGFKGASGKIFDITFGVLGAGYAPVSFTRSEILAHDGVGTNVTRIAENAGYNIIIKSPPTPVPPFPTPTPGPKKEIPKPIIEDYTNPVIKGEPIYISGKTVSGTNLAVFLSKDNNFKNGGDCDIFAPDTVLKQGDENDSVRDLQLFLAENLSIPKDDLVVGYFGLKTKNAVTAFQNKYSKSVVDGDKADVLGEVGSATVLKINMISCGYLKELSVSEIEIKDGTFDLKTYDDLTPGKYNLWLKAFNDSGYSEPSEVVVIVIKDKGLMPKGGNGIGIWDILFILALILTLMLPFIRERKNNPSMKIPLYGSLFFVLGLMLDVLLLRLSLWPRIGASIAVLLGIGYLWTVLLNEIGASSKIIPSGIGRGPRVPPPYKP